MGIKYNEINDLRGLVNNILGFCRDSVTATYAVSYAILVLLEQD